MIRVEFGLGKRLRNRVNVLDILLIRQRRVFIVGRFINGVTAV